MGKIVTHEFLGSRFRFWLLVMTGIGIPFAIIYLLESTVRVEEEVENPHLRVREAKGDAPFQQRPKA